MDMTAPVVWIETDEDADWLIAVQLRKEQEAPGYVADKHLPRPAAVKARRPVVRLVVEKKYDPSQPRFPAGDPRGGQWAPEDGNTSVPLAIQASPGDFLVRIELEDAKLPPTHTDGLEEVKFHNGDYIQSRHGDAIVEALGTYDIVDREILLALNAPRGGNISVFGGRTVLHEIGHHVHLAKLTDEAHERWAAYSRNGQSARISAYARTNHGEHFAEAYRAYAQGKDYRRKLRNIEPEAYKFMQRLFKPSGSPDLLPLGNLTDTHKAAGRYYGPN